MKHDIKDLSSYSEAERLRTQLQAHLLSDFHYQRGVHDKSMYYLKKLHTAEHKKIK